MANDDLAWRTATRLTEALVAREVSALELLDHHLERTERLNGPIQAVVATNPEAARAAAREADAELARGDRKGPLHGLPMTIKDSIEVVGMPTTSGAPELREHVPVRNADATQRLADAGAVFFGKTNLPLYAGDFQSYNEVYGTTNNPWDLERVPGGSSGGSAAALAAGLTPLELGSDIGGSIRNPAHYCGVYGHKPSLGIVSSRGHIPGPPGGLRSADLAVLGPLARAPEDLELALDVLAAPRPEDAGAWKLELPPARHERLADFRVAAWLDDPAAPPMEAASAALHHALVDRLAAAGPKLDAHARPEFDAAASHDRYCRLLYGEMGAGMPPQVLSGFDDALSEMQPSDTSRLSQMIRGASGRHRDWLRDDEARQHLRARWAEFFRDWDVLLCPVMPTAAFPHDHTPFMGRTLDIDGESVEYGAQVFWAGLITVAYLPSTVVPVGRTPEGLPVGLQVVAPFLEDRTSLRFARLLEEEGVIPGFEAPPDFR
jgi:amidase